MVIENYPQGYIGNQAALLNQQAAQQLQARQQAEKDFMSSKQREGYTLNAAGDLEKVEGNITRTITKSSGYNQETIITKAPEIKQQTQLDKLNIEIKKYERALKSDVVTSNARATATTKLKQLYEAKRNLINEGSAYYTVSEKVQNTELKSTTLPNSPGLPETKGFQAPGVSNTANKLYNANFPVSQTNIISQNIQMEKAFKTPVLRLLNPSETTTTQQVNLQLINPSQTSAENVARSQEQAKQEIKQLENSPNVLTAFKARVRGELIGTQEGFASTLVAIGSPVAAIKGLYETYRYPYQVQEIIISQPGSVTAGQLGSGIFAGQFVQLGFNKVSPYVSPFVKGDRQGFISSSNRFVETKLLSNREYLGRRAVRGDTPFVISDITAPTKATALQRVTGDNYYVQTDVFGNTRIIKPVQKGFLAQQGYNLKFDTPRENLVIPTGQTKLFEDTITNFPRGPTESPNVLQSSSAVQTLNPRYKIIDFVNPERNFKHLLKMCRHLHNKLLSYNSQVKHNLNQRIQN